MVVEGVYFHNHVDNSCKFHFYDADDKFVMWNGHAVEWHLWIACMMVCIARQSSN
jgi:hypothetical protein